MRRYSCLIGLLLVTSHCVHAQDVTRASAYSCRSNDDCRYKQSSSDEPCAVCADANSGEAKCLFPFPYMFQHANLSCAKVDPCPIGCPEDRGLCIQSKHAKIVYTPSCECYYRFYGPLCEYKATPKENIINYITWTFKGIIPVFRLTKLAFVAFSHWDPQFDTFQLVLSTNDGYFQKIPGSKAIAGGCYFKSPKCSAFHAQIRFPYKRFNHSDNTEFLTLKDKIVGYYSFFNVTAEDMNKVVYKRQFRVIVSYQELGLKCIALIKLTNCAHTRETPTIFTRLNLIDFISEVQYVSDGGYVSTSEVDERCAADNTFSWKLWRLSGEADDTTPLFENYTNKDWHFDPYSLDLGMYKVLFEVKHAAVNGFAGNFAYCYIKVRSLPLVVTLDGGSDRLVYKDSGLVLSAKQSRDPNMPISSQQDLYVTWSCVRVEPPSNDDPMCVPRTMELQTPYFIAPKLLTYSAVYNFTVVMWSELYKNCSDCYIRPRRAYVRIEVGDETANSSISIQCVDNCKDKVVPKESLFLKVTSDNMNTSSMNNLQWTYSTSSEKDLSIDSFKIEGTPPFMLLLKENSLKENMEYTITATLPPRNIYAKYQFKTDKLWYFGTCKVEPPNGTRGVTFFDITCPLKDNYALLYEFYDKSHEDIQVNGSKTNSFNGRMLGTTSTGQLQNVQLSRGVVTVFIINLRGVSVKKEIVVELTNWNVTNDVQDEMKKNLTDSIHYYGDGLGALRLISLIADTLPLGSNKEKEFGFLIESIAEISLTTFQEIKVASSTLYLVLTSFNNQNQMQLDIYVLVNTLEFIDKIANIFRRALLDRESSQYMPPNEIKDVASNILNCYCITLRCKDTDKGEQEYELVEDLIDLKYSSYVLEDTLDYLKDVLTFIQVPGSPPLEISTEKREIIVWTVVNDIDYPLTNYLNETSNIPVGITSELLNSLTNNKDIGLSLQVVYIKDNLFWWYKSNIESNVVSVSLNKRKGAGDLTKIYSLPHPISVHMTMDGDPGNLRVAGITIQPDVNSDKDYLDLQVRVHRLDIEPRSWMTLSFLFPPTNGSLRVFVMEDYRPDFEYVSEHSITISAESPSYPHRYHDYEEPRFLFMGILPGQDIPINQTVTYAFEVNTTLCQYWKRGSWKSDGCLIGSDTRGREISCQCTHLSTFGAAFLVPPEQIDPFGDAKLFLTVFDNPLVVALVILMLVIYLLLCICLWRMDKKDKVKRSVIILEDNFPLDSHPYLLAVFTSQRWNAGTSAHVGVKLIGDQAESRAHILRSSERKVLRSGCDDWFLIYCPEYLGRIQQLHLWHDNAGWSPSWFCENIFVYDLKDKTETKFVVDQWLALRYMEKEKNQCYPEARVFPAENEDLSSVKRTFIDNFFLGIRDGHKMFSVIFRHPRSHVTRVQRISIVMVYVMVAMLCSIMFYKSTDETTVGIDDYHYSIGMKEFIISIQCLLLGAVLTFIVLFAFRKSYKFDSHNRKVRRSVTPDNVYGRRNKSIYSSFVRFVTSTMKHAPLDPVQLPNSPPVVKLQRIWFIIAWVSCIFIIVSCAYLVMLYGLKLGPVKSKKWLSSVILSIGEDTIILTPVKVLLTAVCLALAFQLLLDINTYEINFPAEKKHSHLWDEDYVETILAKRAHPMYAPISYERRSIIVRKHQVRAGWWSIFEFLTAACFVFVTCNVIFVLWSSNYYTNSHIEKMITNTQFPFLYSTSFNEVRNVTDMEDYLATVFVNVLYNVRWYHRQHLNDDDSDVSKYWASDFANRLVGRPKLRQLRVVPTHCVNIVLENGLCIPEWKDQNEDTNVFAKGWKPGSYVDVGKEDSPWVYKDKSTTLKPILLRLYGLSGRLFHDGGYSATLGPKRLNAEETLDALQDDLWQDIRTRVVFVELTMFNANEALLSQVTLIVEYLVSGTVLLKAQITSVGSSFTLNFWEFLFVIFVVFYILKTIYLVNYFGLLEYLSSGIDGSVRIILILLEIVSILLFCVHFFNASYCTKKLQSLSYDGYFDFDEFIQYFGLLQLTLSLLICVAIFRVIVSIPGGKSLMIHLYSFTTSLITVICLAILIFLLYFVLEQLINSLSMFALLSLKEMLMNQRSMKFLQVGDLETTHVQAVIVLKMICVFIINCLFLVIFLKSARLSKSHVLRSLEMFNLIVFLKSRFGWYKSKSLM